MGIASFSCVAEKAEMRCPIYTTQLAGVSLKIEIHIFLNRRGGGGGGSGAPHYGPKHQNLFKNHVSLSIKCVTDLEV